MRSLKTMRGENIRENDEIYLMNDLKVEDIDEYMLSYNI